MAVFLKALENLNEGTMCVCFFVGLWLILFASRMDNLLILPYWAIFFPLWIWKILVFLGWLCGLIIWFKHWRLPIDHEQYHFIHEDPALPYIKAMSVSVFFHLLIACSEILLCIHLSIPSLNLNYLTIFTPLLIVGALGVFGFLFVMIDSRSVFCGGSRDRRQNMRQINSSDPLFVIPRSRHVCSFTLELCIAANLLQLLFLIARLDNWIRSSWIVTFIPSFILLAMGFLFCLAGLTVALITYFTAFFIPLSQRRLPVCYYASHLLIVILLCGSLVLLSLRLDGYITATKGSFAIVCIPVLTSLFLYTSLSSGPGNPWWFGLNRNVLLAIFESCPALQLCANIRISKTGLWRSPQEPVNSIANATPPTNAYLTNVISSPLNGPSSQRSFDSQSLDTYICPSIVKGCVNSNINYFGPNNLNKLTNDSNQLLLSLNDFSQMHNSDYSTYLIRPD